MYVFLTLSPSAADLPEAGALTQAIEALLFDQLHDLWLYFLPKLPGETSDKCSLKVLIHHFTGSIHKERLKNIIDIQTYSVLGL